MLNRLIAAAAVAIALSGCTMRLHSATPASQEEEESRRGAGFPHGGATGGPGKPTNRSSTPPTMPSPMDAHD
jgi:hypothetical protein